MVLGHHHSVFWDLLLVLFLVKKRVGRSYSSCSEVGFQIETCSDAFPMFPQRYLAKLVGSLEAY